MFYIQHWMDVPTKSFVTWSMWIFKSQHQPRGCRQSGSDHGVYCYSQHFQICFPWKRKLLFFLLWNTSDEGWRINLLKNCTKNSKYTKKRFTCLNYASKSTQLFFIRFFLNKGYFFSLLRLNYFYLCLSNYHNVRSPLHVINKFGIIHLKRQVLARLYSFQINENYWWSDMSWFVLLTYPSTLIL